MYFAEAIQKLIYGKKVRREIWGKNSWIESNGSTVFQKSCAPNDKNELVISYSESDRIFSLEDVTADDWVIYK